VFPFNIFWSFMYQKRLYGHQSQKLRPSLLSFLSLFPLSSKTCYICDLVSLLRSHRLFLRPLRGYRLASCFVILPYCLVFFFFFFEN
jgi:hypothetical protein